MPRYRRVNIPDIPHHVTIRGNYRQPIFLNDGDQSLYLDLLRRKCDTYGVSLDAYCLMPNHIHLIAVPANELAMQRVFRDVHGHYARRVHQLADRTGHLFEKRYFAVPMDNAHYWSAMIYVEQNPLRAGLVRRAAEWQWSSALAHLGQKDNSWLDMSRFSDSFLSTTWRTCLDHGLLAAEELARIRDATNHNRPLGDTAFLEMLERDHHARFRPASKQNTVPGTVRAPVPAAVPAAMPPGRAGSGRFRQTACALVLA